MASFNINTSSTVAQNLALNEVGFIGTAGNLLSLSAAAVTMQASSQLMVMGTAATSGFNTVNILATVEDALITVGREGALVSAAGSAIRGSVRDQFHLINDGLITGFNEAIFVTVTAVAGVTPDFHIANSGRILSNGDASSETTIELFQFAGSTINFANSGTIMNGGLGGVLAIGGGRLDLTNSGVMQARKTAIAIQSDVGNDAILNDGAIIGDIVTVGGSDHVANNGKITGDITMGDGNDFLNNAGTIIGNVSLADSQDTVVNSGLIVGSINLGSGDDVFRNIGGRVTGTVFDQSGDDTYFLDRQDIALADTSGLDHVFASVDFVLGDELENLTLTGNRGLVGIGNESANQMTGSFGDDTLRGGFGSDTINGGAGDDQIFGGSGSDELFGGIGDNVIRGGLGADQLFQSEGDATLFGGAGNDTVTAFSNSGEHLINLADGLMLFAGGNDGTTILDGIESATGGSGGDTIIGSAGNNVLSGGILGNDSLVGGAGSDQLIGGRNRDTLTGGADSDTFVFSEPDSTAAAPDLITDFTLDERISFTFLDIFGGVFLGSGAFTSDPDVLQVRATFNAALGVTVVEVRQLGNVSDFVLHLTGNLALTESNFVL